VRTGSQRRRMDMVILRVCTGELGITGEVLNHLIDALLHELQTMSCHMPRRSGILLSHIGQHFGADVLSRMQLKQAVVGLPQIVQPIEEGTTIEDVSVNKNTLEHNRRLAGVGLPTPASQYC